MYLQVAASTVLTDKSHTALFTLGATPVTRTAVPPYRRTAVPPYRRTAVPPYRRTAGRYMKQLLVRCSI